MKLWYQSLARQTEVTPYGKILRKIVDSSVDPGTTVHIQGLSEAAGIGAHYRFLEHHDTREVMYNAMRAQREGYDAFLIGNITDAGIREVRELLSIPVLGLCETALHLACMMGANFALVTINERFTLRTLENVRRYGLESRLVGYEPLSTSPLELKDAMVNSAHRQRITDEFTQAADRLIAKGAEVIIPAGGDVIVFLAENEVFQIGNTPVLNAIVELVKMGETSVKLQRRTGRFISKRATYSTPTGDFLQKIRAAYGPDIYPGVK